MIKTIIIKYKN